FFSESLKVKEEANDQFGKANVLISMAGIYRETRNFDETKKIIEEVLQISRQIKAEALISKALVELGLILSEKQAFTEAAEIFSQALVSFEKQNHQSGIAECLLQVGKINAITGQEENARSNFQKALSVAEQIGDKNSIMFIRFEIAELEMQKGNMID